MDLIKDHEIFIGTYEEHTVGYKPVKDSELLTIFTERGHNGAVRCLGTAGKFLVTGAADEVVKIYNLRNKTEHGNLHHHEGTINVLKFFGDKFLFTGGEDGKICILKTKGWAVEKTLVKHSSGIIDLSIHPSGKLALSIAKDRKLITWNLIKGRSAYVSNIKEMADFVQWSPEGKYYLVGFYKRVDIYDLETAEICGTVELKGRSNAVAFLDEETYVLAGEMSELQIHSIKQKKLLYKFEAHENRVRCIHVERAENGKLFTLVSASNDGFIKFWKIVRDNDSFEVEEVMSHNTKCRITCLSVHKVPEVKTVAPAQKIDPNSLVLPSTGKKTKKNKKKVQMTKGQGKQEAKAEKRKLQGTVVVEQDHDDDAGGDNKTPRKKIKKKKVGAV